MRIRISCRPARFLFFAVFATAKFLPPGQAASVTLTPSADTTLMELTPFNNMGAVESLATGVTGHGTFARALLKFDLSGIPANAVVTGVELTLPIVRESALVEGTTFDLHRVKVGWGEGTKGAGVLTGLGLAATEGEATWAARQHPLTLWGSGGGSPGDDFEAVPSASAEPGAALVFQSTVATVADVQAWVDAPSANFGWLIKDSFESDTSQTARRLASKELAGTKPQLVVTYSESAVLRIVDVVYDAGQLCFKFAGVAGKSYTVERRSNVAAGNWEVIQTIPTVAVGGLINICDPLGAGPAFYRVAER